MRNPSKIPAVWRIDVEPDEHRPPVAEKPWEGFADMFSRVETLSRRLEEKSGRSVRPTWLLRMDPDIERCFGRADFVIHRHGELIDRLQVRNHPVGIHVHYYRWNAERAVAFSDYADAAWTTQCFRVSVDAFRNSFGRSARISSCGGYFLTERLLDAAVEAGISVELTVEPGRGPKAADISFGAYATAPSSDFIACPRYPYYPSRQALAVPSSSQTDVRPILMVPMTAFAYQHALQPWRQRAIDRVLGRPRPHAPLSAWRKWPSPQVFWDFVQRAVNEQRVPYVAFATRTDDPKSESYKNVWELFDYLPHHPLAEHLDFVDPLGPEIQALATP
jgi:hypothetical protein